MHLTSRCRLSAQAKTLNLKMSHGAHPRSLQAERLHAFPLALCHKPVLQGCLAKCQLVLEGLTLAEAVRAVWTHRERRRAGETASASTTQPSRTRLAARFALDAAPARSTIVTSSAEFAEVNDGSPAARAPDSGSRRGQVKPATAVICEAFGVCSEGATGAVPSEKAFHDPPHGGRLSG